jgi:hypothetical protein
MANSYVQNPGAERGTAERSAEEIALESARYRRLQRAFDVALALIQQTPDLQIGDTIEMVLETRRIALDLFPGSDETFNLLYRPRLLRAITERFGIQVQAD